VQDAERLDSVARDARGPVVWRRGVISTVYGRITGDLPGLAFAELNADDEGSRAMAELSGREIDAQNLTVVEARLEILGRRRPSETRGRIPCRRPGGLSRHCQCMGLEMRLALSARLLRRGAT